MVLKIRHLHEALKKSMINKLEKHNNVLTKFTKDDLKNGDLIIKKGADGLQVWMYLDNDEARKRLNEFRGAEKLENIVYDNESIIVYPDGYNYGLYRTVMSDLREKDGYLYFYDKEHITYKKLIKTHGKFLNDNLSIKEIYQNNNYFKDFLTEK